MSCCFMSRRPLTTPIVLHDLVVGVLGTTTDDIRRSRGLFDRNRILTHVLEPDVVQVAWTETVHALGLFSANHDVSAAILA